MFQILTPVIVRISGIEIAVFVTTNGLIEIRQVTRIAEEYCGHTDKEHDTEEHGNQFSGNPFFFVAFVEISEGLANHHVEKREDWEEVAKADVEISGDADIAIEEDKEYRQILGYIVME